LTSIFVKINEINLIKKIFTLRDTIKILILNDVEEEVKSLIQFLVDNGYSFPIVAAKNMEEFIGHLNEYKPNVILSEHELSGFNSLQALNKAKEIDPHVVYILISSKIEEEFGLELLKEGMDVYFTRDRLFQLPSVIEKICKAIVLENQVKKLEESNKKLKEAYKESSKKNESITQSIQFAKRIQMLTLPKIDLLLKNFQDAFILYMPKDIVSGDFYWFNNGNGSGRFMIAVGDCTGHGVSGSLLSMIGYNLLNDIIMDEATLINPSEILFQLNTNICKVLKQDLSTTDCGYQDGIDMSFVSIDRENKKIYFCGCKRPLLYMIRNEKKLVVYKGEPYIVGGTNEGIIKTFKTQEIDFKTGDIIYMLTDGYTDQFGGENDKKLMRDKFADILLSIQHLNLNYQSQLLEQKIIKWRGNTEQTDDILIVGIKL